MSKAEHSRSCGVSLGVFSSITNLDARLLTINLVLGVQLNLSITSATNETRAFPRVGREKAHSSTRTRWIFGHCRVSNMGRAIVEEIATLASLALFVGMVAIWAQVIATL
jgi:hypothetical protein